MGAKWREPPPLLQPSASKNLQAAVHGKGTQADNQIRRQSTYFWEAKVTIEFTEQHTGKENTTQSRSFSRGLLRGISNIQLSTDQRYWRPEKKELKEIRGWYMKLPPSCLGIYLHLLVFQKNTLSLTFTMYFFILAFHLPWDENLNVQN